jgi:hypothetical protein
LRQQLASSQRKKNSCGNALDKVRSETCSSAGGSPVPKSDRTYATLFACSARIPASRRLPCYPWRWAPGRTPPSFN